jgi:Cu/Ag efflux pump CusA
LVPADSDHRLVPPPALIGRIVAVALDAVVLSVAALIGFITLLGIPMIVS